MVHHVPKGRERAIVHIGPGDPDIAQGLALEGADIGRVFGHQKPAELGIGCLQGEFVDLLRIAGLQDAKRLAGELSKVLLVRGDPDIVKFLVGEQRRHRVERVAGAAAPLALKQCPATLGLIADRLRVPSQEAIERRIGGILRPLESRDRRRDIFVSGIAPQERFERVRIFLDPSDLRDDIAGRLLAHFNWVENRKLGLILERGRAAIPELRRLKHRVQHGRRIALAMLVLDARGRRAVAAMIGKSLGGIVAGLAGDRVIDRKPLVLEQFFAESGKLRRRLAPWRHGQGIELRRNAKGQGGFKRRLLLGSSKCESRRRGRAGAGVAGAE